MTRNKTFIIAEAGVNHNGSLELALKLIDAASAAGVDAVKFQTFKTEKLVSRFAPKAEYQTKNTGTDESQFAMIKRLELDDKQHLILAEHCRKQGLEFMSTPFDAESVDFLAKEMGLKRLKIPSGEITNAPLLLKFAQTGRALILSTGMCTLDDVEIALGVLAFGYTCLGEKPSVEGFKGAFATNSGLQYLQDKVTLLHCTTEYPAPFDEVNLQAMDTLKEKFALRTGYSDHTTGITVPIAAVARGAVVIEKHFTLDRNLPGPDHRASLEPEELKNMVIAIRQIELALGKDHKAPTTSELKNMIVARKSLVALCEIRRGEKFTPKNLGVKRPGNGISPLRYWEWLDKEAQREYRPDEVIEE